MAFTSIQIFCLLVIAVICFTFANAAAFNLQQFRLQSRIVGGSAATKGDFSYLVSIRAKKNKVHFCGGAIINSFYILSATHCFIRGRNENNIFVVVGAHKLDGDGTPMEISRLILHPSFELKYTRHDIALLQTEREISFNDYFWPIALPTTDIPTDIESKAIISGWGLLTVISIEFIFSFISYFHFAFTNCFIF